MDISVVIPTFNRAHLLSRAVESVLDQSRSATEIIVVDDGSTDETGALMAGRFPGCQYIFQENSGVSSARNLGIKAARGEWIALLDSDDEWLPNKLKNQEKLIVEQPYLRLCHTEEIWIRNDRRVNAMKKHAKSGGDIFQRCLPHCVISPSSVLIQRSLLFEVGLFDELLPVCEDYDLWLRICARYPVGYVEKPQIIKYGGHEDQLSRRYWGMDRYRIAALEKIIAYEGLEDQERRATAATLCSKAKIVAHGAEKRGKKGLAMRFNEIARQYAIHEYDKPASLM